MKTPRQRTALKRALDLLYEEYDFVGRLGYDPIEIPRRYQDPGDIEVAAFISSCFAYGRVDFFKPVVERLLGLMGRHPAEFIMGFDVGGQRKRFSGIKYRFNENDDILALFHALRQTLELFGSIEGLFKHHDDSHDQTTLGGLRGIVSFMSTVDTTPVYGADRKPAGFLQFLPYPDRGSACKRINLFLRWVVRDRDIDLGLWKGIATSRLVIPLDTHIARIATCLGFTRRRTAGWEMAVEITEALKRFDPEDPLKYDFALCHQGIAGVCAERQCGCCRLFRVR